MGVIDTNLAIYKVLALPSCSSQREKTKLSSKLYVLWIIIKVYKKYYRVTLKSMKEDLIYTE